MFNKIAHTYQTSVCCLRVASDTWKDSNLLFVFDSRKQAERGTELNCTKITQHNSVPFSNDWLASVDGANEVVKLYVLLVSSV